MKRRPSGNFVNFMELEKVAGRKNLAIGQVLQMAQVYSSSYYYAKKKGSMMPEMLHRISRVLEADYRDFFLPGNRHPSAA